MRTPSLKVASSTLASNAIFHVNNGSLSPPVLEISGMGFLQYFDHMTLPTSCNSNGSTWADHHLLVVLILTEIF